ncbi:MAG: T9SS type A sorting domain-containing protein [Bacteroidetes bacterium]|nr:T9SS type A sorting domain-containing protein [Bacteroidota bacterium]
MKKTFIVLVFLFSTLISGSEKLSLFSISQFYDEQEYVFGFSDDIFININAPAVADFDPDKPVLISLYALPNGNTTDHTIGRVLRDGDDWHYDIQHIGAQTRFLRKNFNDYNYVTVYLETSQKSWPAWKAAHSDHAVQLRSLVDSIQSIFGKYFTQIVLTGHSGGGRFTFSFLDNFQEIPDFVKRITFLDSNYGYETIYGEKIAAWLQKSNENYLCTIAYNDSVALYNGQPVVSATGGTWYRSRMMKKFLENYFTFSTEEDDEFIKHTALNGRVKIILKKNPDKLILHTVQVERNGYIHGILSGTEKENINYSYYGERAYSGYIQKFIPNLKQINIPDRNPQAIGGKIFMNAVSNLSFANRESRILEEISSGNIPGFLRNLLQQKAIFTDANGISHTIYYQVMPDYLAIGSNDDYCRIPMGPLTAQKIANLFNMVLPTSKLVDNIYINATTKLEPVTYPWVAGLSESVARFVEHNSDINNQLIAKTAVLGELVGGTKKDVVLSNKITDPARPNHVTIYGWHKLDGNPIQPLTNIHIDTYVDYSHGIRLLNSEVLIDSVVSDIREVLKDAVNFRILSNESTPMEQTSYLKDETLPEKPKSFGVINEGNNSIKLIIPQKAGVINYHVSISTDGINFTKKRLLTPTNLLIDRLGSDSLYFIQLQSENESGLSAKSEMLACATGSKKNRTLIVNGFDRLSDGNTFNFIRQHASSFFTNDLSVDAVTNDAVKELLVELNDYEIVDYILGEESTADETFDIMEQEKISNFLNNGGKLLVSGSEIGWDLDYKGSQNDKNFCYNYLKTKYVSDAPYNISGKYYTAAILPSSPFGGLASFFFDDGTHGTYNVDWPDLIKPVNGAKKFMGYAGVDTTLGWSGIYYEGMFPKGNSPGKLVLMSFPFETIYPAGTRNDLMKKFIAFFNNPTEINESGTIVPQEYKLYQNYPNPFNPTTTIDYELSSDSFVELSIFNLLGEKVQTIVSSQQPAGKFTATFNSRSLSSGVYFYTLTITDIKRNSPFSITKKMTVLK